MIYVLERVIVESASLANIILTKPQLSEQALSLLTLLEPIPPHVCLSTRRVAAVFYLLPSLYPSLTTPTRWSHIFNLLMADATNELARPLVWQALCRLLEEKKISVINFIPVLKCCLQTRISFSPLTTSRSESGPVVEQADHRVHVRTARGSHVALRSPATS